MTCRNAVSRTLIVAVAWMAAGQALAAPGDRVVFVGCPILRDTALPCWMGKDRDKLYAMGPQTDLQSDFYPPQFRHKMLVEATEADGPKICGGTPLKNITASVLPDIDDTCNVILPGEGYPDAPNIRGTGPSGVRGGAPPAERPRRGPPPTPVVSTTPSEFVATFNADSDRKWRPATTALNNAAAYAKAANAARIEITGYRAAIKLSDGHDFIEREDVAEARARTAEEAMRVLGVPASTEIKVTWEKKALASNGTPQDAANRKVVLRVIPGAAPAKTASAK